MCALSKGRGDVFPGGLTGDQDHLLPKVRTYGWRLALTPNIDFLLGTFGDLGNLPLSKVQFKGNSWKGQKSSMPGCGHDTAGSVHRGSV